MNDRSSIDRFDGRSTDYARYRPSYPSGAIDAVLAGLGDPATLRAVDVGAGTGISVSLLVERGVRAVGIEPNAGMRERASHLGLHVRAGSVTENDLPRGEADLVTAFQAYHWFADEVSTRALASLLRPGGRIALVWNLFDRYDPFTDGFCDLLDRFADARAIAGLGYERAAAATANLPSADPPLERVAPAANAVAALEGADGSTIAAALRRGGFAHLRIREVPYVQRLDEAALLGRLRSSSSAPTHGPPYDAMAAGLHDLVIAQVAGAATGEYELAHRTHVILGELSAPANRG